MAYVASRADGGSKASPKDHPRLPALDGLRGVCAFSVMLSHLIWNLTEHQAGTRVFPGLVGGHFGLFDNISVVIFFALSGFVIGYSTPERFSGSDLRAYVIRRCVRVVPIYVIGVLLAWAVAARDVPLDVVAYHLGFLQVAAGPTILSNGPLWSLHFEVMFYVLYPIVWYFRISVPVLIVGLLLVALNLLRSGSYVFYFSAYFAIWCAGLWLSRRTASTDAPSRFTNPGLIWFAIAAFSLASPVNLLFDRIGTPKPDGLDFRNPLLDVLMILPILLLIGRLSSRRVPFGVVATGAILAVSAVLAAGALVRGIPLPQYSVILAYVVSALFCSAFAVDWRSWLARLKPLGDVSYGLYATHAPVFFVTLSLVAKGDGTPKLWAVGLLSTLAALGVAVFTERVLHTAIASQVRQRLTPRPPRTATPA